MFFATYRYIISDNALAAGYATFKQVNVNLLLLATTTGYGEVVDNQARKEIFMRMGSLGGGIGAGVEDGHFCVGRHSPVRFGPPCAPARS